MNANRSANEQGWAPSSAQENEQGWAPSSAQEGAARRLRFAPASPFAQALFGQARAEFAATGEHRFADTGLWLQGAGFLAVGVAAYAAILSGAPGAGATVAFAMLAALCAFMLMTKLGHDAAHGSLSPHRWLNGFVVFATFALLGASGALWRSRHVRLHHAFPNVPDTGIDADSSSWLRLSPHNPWRPVHALQPGLCPLLYAVGILHMTWIEDFQRLAAARRDDPAAFGTGRALAAFVAAKAIHTTLFLVLPAVLLGPPPVALLGTYLAAMATASIAFVTISVGTHISALAAFPLPDAVGRLPHDWATHQVVTAVDWLPTSRPVIALVGGANADAAHHLFPEYSHRHLARLSRIVADQAAAHGIPHHALSFGAMMRAHWRHIWRLSRPAIPARAAFGSQAG